MRSTVLHGAPVGSTVLTQAPALNQIFRIPEDI